MRYGGKTNPCWRSLFWRVIATLFVALMTGCKDEQGDAEQGAHRKGAGMAAIRLDQRHSGYAASQEHWSDFLTCFEAGERHQFELLLKQDKQAVQLPLVGSRLGALRQTANPEDIVAAIQKLEKSLGTALPKSYKDFLMVYRPSLLQPQTVPWGEALVGFLAPSQVGRLADLRPELVRAHQGLHATNDAPDKKYFIYGKDQDDATSRPSYLRNAILIGLYGESEYETILLYPQARTADGEMEAATISWAGEFRAPSFAELMRQMSFFTTRSPEHGPPFAQSTLKGSCADKLPLKDVWWE